MLVLTAKEGDSIYIDGGRVVLSVVKIGPHRTTLGFVAPPEVVIDRKDVHLNKLSRLPKPEKPND